LSDGLKHFLQRERSRGIRARIIPDRLAVPPRDAASSPPPHSWATSRRMRSTHAPGIGRSREDRRTRRGRPRHAASPGRSPRISCECHDSQPARCGTRVRRPRPRIRSMPESPGNRQWLPPPDRQVQKGERNAKVDSPYIILYGPGGTGRQCPSPSTRKFIRGIASPGKHPGRNRSLSENRSAVCLIFVPVFVLFLEERRGGIIPPICSLWRNGSSPRCSSSSSSAGCWSDSC